MKIRFLNSKLYKPKSFEYRPRYYDERKEELERKKAMYRRAEEGTLTEEERRAMLKEHIRDNWGRGQHRQNQSRSANFRVILLVGIIVVLGYFIFFGLESVDKIVENIF